MAFDLNEAEEQTQRNHGPVPMGSRVLLKMEYKEVRNAHPQSPYISISKNGFYMAWIEFTVQGGAYDGVHWRENWMLPAGMQKVALSEGQSKACSITYTKMRAIVEAHRGIDPKDKSAQAAGKRKLGSIMDLNGMEFPAVVGLAKEGREVEGRDGKTHVYWDNIVSTIITPDRRDYAEIKAGGEWINPEGITSRDNGNSRQQPRNDDPFGAPANDDFGAFPSENSDCPF